MNICLVTPFYKTNKNNNSGLANYFYDLSKDLSSKGHKVIVLLVTEEVIDETTINKISTPNLEIKYELVRIPKFINRFVNKRWAIKNFVSNMIAVLITFIKLNKTIKNYKIDIVETTSTKMLCLMNILFNYNKSKIIIRVSTLYCQLDDNHYPFESRAFKILSFLEKLMIKRGKHLITNTESHLKNISKLLEINSSRFRVINHGIRIPELDMSINSNVFNVLFVGRFEERKGFDIVLKVAKKVLSKNYNIKFTLVGSVIENSKYYNDINILQKLGNSKIDILGVVSDIELNKLYNRSNIVLAPSRYESFGLVFIEAMSYSNVLIALNAPSANEIIRDEIDGFLVENESIDDICELIIELYQDNIKCIKIGKEARNKVIENFSNKLIIEKTEKYYSEIIE